MSVCFEIDGIGYSADGYEVYHGDTADVVERFNADCLDGEVQISVEENVDGATELVVLC